MCNSFYSDSYLHYTLSLATSMKELHSTHVYTVIDPCLAGPNLYTYLATKCSAILHGSWLDICQRLRGRKIWVCPGGATQNLPPSPGLWWQVLGCATETSMIFRPA